MICKNIKELNGICCDVCNWGGNQVCDFDLFCQAVKYAVDEIENSNHDKYKNIEDYIVDRVNAFDKDKKHLYYLNLIFNYELKQYESIFNNLK